MTVWIDGQVFENQSQVGIWRTFYEVLSRVPDRQQFVLWLRGRPAQPIPSGVRVVRDGGRIPARSWNVVTRSPEVESPLDSQRAPVRRGVSRILFRQLSDARTSNGHHRLRHDRGR